MTDILRHICAEKRGHVMACKAVRPLSEIEMLAARAPQSRGFIAALRAKVKAGNYGLIGEIKKASPSKGLIREDFEPASLASAYQAGGASCLSILTDTPNFQGENEHLKEARSATTLPVLRKDFMLDPYQVFEARAIGADCILLIMAALSDAQAEDLVTLASELGMDVLVEVHDEKELEHALLLDTTLIGINNRNLKSLEVNLETSELLAPLVPPDRLSVSESGLATPDDIKRMADAGFQCFLVGEALMQKANVEEATRKLVGAASPASF